MPVSPRDFELYSRMTGAPMPMDASQRMQMAPAVYDFTKNFARKPNILEKNDEAIWFANDKTIKFSVDKKFISDRVKRKKTLDYFVPKILGHSDNFYCYKFIEGKVFSEVVTAKKFEYLLSWLDRFWVEKKLNKTEKHNFKTNCKKFYKDKTIQRVKLYFDTYYNKDSDEIVNDKRLPTLDSLLSNDSTSLSNSMSQYFSTLQAATDSPTSIPVRQMILAEANVLSQRFNNLYGRLSEINASINQQLGALTEQVSTLAYTISQLNTSIADAMVQAGGALPNDLLDERDEVLR